MRHLRLPRHVTGTTLAIRAVAVGAAVGSLLTGMTLTAPAASAAWGHRAYHCVVHYGQASVSTNGIKITAYQRACYARSRYGSKFMPATSSPHYAFTATNPAGNLASFTRNWGPTVTYTRRQIMSPWQFPNILDPNYDAWLLTHPHYRHTVEVRQTSDYTLHSISVAGVSVKSEVVVRTRIIVGKGMQVCDMTDHECSEWRRLS